MLAIPQMSETGEKAKPGTMKMSNCRAKEYGMVEHVVLFKWTNSELTVEVSDLEGNV